MKDLQSIIQGREVREYSSHRINASQVHTRIVITAALPLGEVKTMSRVEVTGTGPTKMNRGREMLLLLWCGASNPITG